MSEICSGCGQVTGIEQYDERLWDIYHRIDDGRQYRQALVFTSADMDGAYDDPEEEFEVTTRAMERNMAERGLCVVCGRPDLTGVPPEHILSEEDARAMAEMAAEREAERRAGCG